MLLHFKLNFIYRQSPATATDKTHINPLLPNGNYRYRIIKISFLKKRRDQEKNSNERRVYDSVDDESLS